MPTPATHSARKKLLDIFAFEPGEARPTLLLTLYLLLAIASMIALKAASEALYLGRFPTRTLPYIYVITAVVVSLIVSAYIKLSDRLSQDRLLIYTQLFFVSNLVVFWWMLHLDQDWVSAIILVWSGIFAVILISQVWTLANHIFTTRQARRLFSFISSGGILGGALGGQFSALVIRRIGAEKLFLVYVPFLLACSVIVFYLWRTTRHLATAGSSKSKQPSPSTLIESLRLIRGSPYLSSIFALVFLSAILGIVVKFEFTYIVRHAFLIQGPSGPDRVDVDRMAAFLSDFSSYLAIVSLVMHLLLSSRVMRWFGLNSAIFVLPVAMLLGSTILLFSASLIAGILIKGFDQGFRHSIDRSATELLYVPLPSRLRQQAKSFIDMVAARWADGVGGLLLIPLTSRRLHLTMPQLAWVNLALILPWLGVAWRLRREYQNTLRSSIERKDISAEALLVEMAGAAPIEELAATLTSSDDRAVETGLAIFEYGQAELAATQLGSLLTHMSPTIRRKALAIVSAKDVPDCAPQVSVFLFLENHIPSLLQALEYLERHDPGEAYVRWNDLLEAPHALLRATVAARLLARGDAARREKATQVLDAFVEMARKDTAYREAAAELLGRAPGDLACQLVLSDFLRDESLEVVRAASVSAGRVRQQCLLPQLIDLSGDRRFRTEARAALAAYGPDILPTLSESLMDARLPLPVRRGLPRVFSAIGGQKAADHLSPCLGQIDLELQYQVLRALSRIRLRQPAVRLDAGRITPLTQGEVKRYYRYVSILQVVPSDGPQPGTVFLRRALAERLERKMEIIFRLIGLLYPPKDIFDAYYGISSGRRDLRSNALEFLDGMLMNPLRQMLLPVIENRSPERILEYGRSFFGIVPPTYVQALHELLTESDPWLQSCAVYVVADQRIRELAPLLDPLADVTDRVLQETVAMARLRLGVAPAGGPTPGTVWKT